jgi:hypothetical protein
MTQAFTASVVPGEGFSDVEYAMQVGWTLFADPDYWKGKLRE